MLRVLAIALLGVLVVPGRAEEAIVLDAASGGRVFDGAGAISGGGGNTRLLFDYAEPYRSQILDALFKPKSGANLQILKVEIGSDCDSTDGAEASHMHARDEENYDRGYEWWLMEEAKKRQPAIQLSALPWGAPGWMGGGHTYFTPEMIDYILKWLHHAESDHHLTIDTIGGRNENGYSVAWYKKFKAALRSEGFSSMRVVASDDWYHGKVWAVASEMQKDPELNDAIDILGGHTPHEDGYASADALALNKPLWASEDHFDEKSPGKEMARSLNRNYIQSKITATIFWPIVSAIYDNLPFDNVGLIKCNQPWSGHYSLTPAFWVMAHTAQFAQPGWHYLDSGCGFFAGDASGAQGSYVTLAAPKNEDYSVIVETVDAKDPATRSFTLEGLPAKSLHVWKTNLNSGNSADWFVRQADVAPTGGAFSLTLQPGCVYSLTTTDGQQKVEAASPPSAPFPFPYADDFEGTPGHPGRYCSDLTGSFEIVPSGGGRSGFALRQCTPQPPIGWKTVKRGPFTILGNLGWTDYRVSCDVLLEKPGAADLMARVNGMSGADVPHAYLLRLADTGAWSLVRSTTQNQEIVLASGTVAAPGLGTWSRLGLVCRGTEITAEINGQVVGAVSEPSDKAGMIGLGTRDYSAAEFGQLRVEAVGGP